MTGWIETCGGKRFALPVLYRWELCYTGGVPCDSFSLRCAYDSEMADILRSAVRFVATENGQTAFCGVIDEYSAVCDEKGQWLEMSGRGLAALLLDNEAEALNYQRATMEEILRNHVQPYGIRCGQRDELVGADYRVESGSSEWKALSSFTHYYGGFWPYFTRSGELVVQKERTRRTLVLDGKTPVTALKYRDRRYGVVSEVVMVNRKTCARTEVRNEAFLRRGGRCRRICYLPANTSYRRVRYTGDYQIERSREGSEELTATILGAFDADAGDLMQVKASALGVTGLFCVTEVVRRFGADGETTTLTMQRE